MTDKASNAQTCANGRLLLFGGTTEARELLEHGLPAICCVATEYGAELVRDLPNVETRVGRLNQNAMQELLVSEKITCVIDATHPYAVEVTANIKRACTAVNVPLLRVTRPATLVKSDFDTSAQDVIRVPSCDAAATWLNDYFKICSDRDKSRVLLTIGTKELAAFTKVRDYQERLVARVLPTVESLRLCTEAGFDPSHIIAMRGPFSRDMNIATLRDIGASILVTKDSGTSGGTDEKILAAREVGAKVILITRPLLQDKGVSVNEALLWVRRQLGVTRPPFFPLMIDLENKLVLVVGGGKIAGRRAMTLLKCGARVRAVSPAFHEKFPAVSKKLERIKRTFEPNDLEGVVLATIATDDREVNRSAGHEARRCGVPVSVADAAAECDYFFPSLIASGATAVSVSSAGLSATLTRRLSDRLRAVWDNWVDEVNSEIGNEPR